MYTDRPKQQKTIVQKKMTETKTELWNEFVHLRRKDFNSVNFYLSTPNPNYYIWCFYSEKLTLQTNYQTSKLQNRQYLRNLEQIFFF